MFVERSSSHQVSLDRLAGLKFFDHLKILDVSRFFQVDMRALRCMCLEFSAASTDLSDSKHRSMSSSYVRWFTILIELGPFEEGASD